ncbi:hypothetical protein GYM62_19335 [Algoriphagus sp. NBT04N3]|uniref:DUF6090 family protein n=1 Tax=Algoriphagus sp. NBT04N3 TaxID=2705473 RepID=UPI001C62C1C9|nr:DUF6090 family protein [Algoriphagus sp. NBT04N3]QYH40847.1 hypothetical protein GYM62_19335 [Algoriphagus sp. NBT04N3]
MLRFFRHIRKKLIEQDKVRNYIWYALGEIFLVMIGILLALQVNNWNEERKEKKLSDEYLSRIAEDLDRLVEISGNQKQKMREILSSITEAQQLLERGTPLSDYEKEIVDFAKVWFPRTTNQLPTMLTYEEMKESGNLNLIRNIPLRNELAELYSYLLQVKSTFGRLSADTETQFTDYNKYLWAHTNPKTLEITNSYDFDAMSRDKELINTFSRISVY